MRKILANFNISLSLVFLVFIILNWFNQKMDFIGNSLSIRLLVFYCILTIRNNIELLTCPVKRLEGEGK